MEQSPFPNPFRNEKAQYKLKPGKIALYIGVAFLDSVTHMRPYVSADTYMCSGLELSQKEQGFQLEDCNIIFTNTDGFTLPTQNVGFVMIDQAAIGDEHGFLRKLEPQTIVLFWLADDDDLRPEDYVADGLKQLDGLLFIKT